MNENPLNRKLPRTSRWHHLVCALPLFQGFSASFTALALAAVLTPKSAADILTFQQGVNGYTGLTYATLQLGAPDAAMGGSSATTWTVDGGNTTIFDATKQGLIRFDNIFGSGAGQIPLGSTINSATISANFDDPSGSSFAVNRMLVTWSAASTWNSMVTGVANDGVEAVVADSATVANPNGNATGTYNPFGTALTADLQLFSNGTANYGWLVRPTAGVSGWGWTASAGSPVLTVDYVPAPTGFTAYNDCAMTSTGNVTSYQIVDTGYTPSGLLKDYTTGAATGVTATASASAALVLWTDPVVNVPYTTGTDADTFFTGKLDFVGSPELNSDTEYYQYTFTGLDPAKSYEFVTTMNRASSGYTTRLTTYTLSGATSFVNSSSTGTTVSTTAVANDSTTLCSGYNTLSGHVARWTNIKASSGTFSVKAMRVAGTKAYGFGMFMLKETPAVSIPAQYVIVISVDGLGGTYLGKMFDGTATGGPYAIPNFTRFKNQGAGTLAAHNDNNNYETLPNHTSIITGRPRDNSPGFDGHNWAINGDPAVGQTIHTNKGSYVVSVFDVAHDNGLRTGMYANKSKFSLFDTYGSYTGGGSYNATYGALDTILPDNGRDKIDNTYINTTLGGIVVDTFIAQQTAPATRNQYAFVHINEPDDAGHGSGWGTAPWYASVVTVDGMLGKIFKLIETDVPAMTGKTAIILTADHGYQGAPGPDTYQVPFYVWGPGVTTGADLYTLNAGKRQVASTYPMTTYSGIQPVRNAEASNLALDLLGLGPIPGSSFDFAQDLVVSGGAPPVGPTVALSLSSSSMPEAGGTATVTATLSAIHTLPVTVNLAFTGTATLTSDYTRSGTSISIPVGSTTGTIILTAVQDAVYESPNETIVVDIGTVDNATESGTQTVTATIIDDDLPPGGVTTAYEPFDTYANGTLLSAISGWWTAGTYTVISGGGVAGSAGIGTDGGSQILNWQGQPFQWSTLAAGTKVAMTMDFQTSASGNLFDDDRVGWTVDAASNITSANQLALQLDVAGMECYWDSNRTVLNPLSGIKVSTWYRFNVEYTKLTATSAGIIGTLTELDASGNPIGTPYVGTIADSSAAPYSAPAGRFTSTSQWPSFKNYSATGGNADNARLTITPPAPPVTTLLNQNFDSMGSAGTTLPAAWTAGYLGAVGTQNWSLALD